MSSASVATSETTNGKLPAIKLAHDSGGGDSSGGVVPVTSQDDGGATAAAAVAVTTTQVVIIKAESCDESAVTTSGNIPNGGTTMNSGADSEGAAVAAAKAPENGGTMDSLEAGVARVTINGTNQNRMIRTASAKSKHLTRSHAMRESASPPRSPACNGASSPQTPDAPDAVDVTTSTPPEVTTPPKIMDNGKATTTSQLDLDFPKLNAPKPKSPRNMDKSQSSSDSSKSVNSLDPHSPTGTLNRKQQQDGRNLSPSSQHSNKEFQCALDTDNSPLLSPGSYNETRSSGREHSKSPSGEGRNYHNSSSGGSSGGKKHKGGGGGGGASAAKNAKTPRLKAQGSSSSVEGNNNNNNSTVFISKDNSFEQFTDQSGVDLIKFFRETLNKNAKDRSMLLKIEKELHDLATDRNRHQVKFPSMSSYNRMLIHRCAAYFGMDHNVDTSQTSVIVAVTKSTRIPEILFDTLIRESLLDGEPRKSILKRDAHSFDECRQSLLPNPDRGLLDRKAKSFEEREEEYEKARRRIFKGRESVGYHQRGGIDGMQDENSWPWSSTESSDNSMKIKAQNNRLLKVHSLSVDTRHDRPSVSKSHSFGGYGGPSGGGNHHGHHLNRGDSITSTKSAGPRFFTKQDSMGGTPWRLSPSSSGSIYYFDPSNVPPIAMKMTHHGQLPRHYPPPFMAPSGGGGAAAGPPNRRRSERSSNRGPGEENVPSTLSSKEKSSSTSIDVIPEDQFQGSCITPTGAGGGVVHGLVSVNMGNAVPSEEGSHYTKGETPSPDDLEDSSDKVALGDEIEDLEEQHLEVDNVERIFVPEHKNQATSPSHPMAQQHEEYVVQQQAASDTELASSSQCLTPPPQQPPQDLDEEEPVPQPAADAIETSPAEQVDKEETGDGDEEFQVPQEEVEGEITVDPPQRDEEVNEEQGHEEGELAATATDLLPPTGVTTNATSPTDSHLMTIISTTCTTTTSSPSSSTHNAPPTVETPSVVGESIGGSGYGRAATTTTSSSAVPYKTYNRYHNTNNSQGDPRSSGHSTTIASPSNASTGYQVHAMGQPQFVAQMPPRIEDQMQAYHPTGITYSTTAIDANGNPYGAANIPYTATYQQMPESGGYMVYAAPYPVEAVNEMPGYYVPVYDQAGNATLVPATATGSRDPQQTTTILQAAAPPGTHVYQAAPNTTLIPALPAGSQLVYTPDGQFAAAAGMQQPQQFTASYPPGTTVTYAPYGTAYNTPSTYHHHPNFWGQPMTTTYYVSSPPAPQLQPPSAATAMPIQIPVPMPPPPPPQQQQQVNPSQQQQVKSGTHSSPPTPQATTFNGGNPFAATAGGHMNDSMHVPPHQQVYAMSLGGGGQQNKYQNMYPYSTPVVPMPPPSVVASASATPPTAIYQPSPSSYQGNSAVSSNKPAAATSSQNAVNESSSTTSTPLQKSPPVQMPETTTSGAAGGGYDKKPRREMNSQQQQGGPPTGGPPVRTGYLGNNYNSAYARNPNQTYTPRGGYAPKKQHYGAEGGQSGAAPNGMNKPIVLNAPMNQTSPSPGGIYSHYHHPQGQQTAGGPSHQAPPHQGGGGGIRGPRPKPPNLDLRRTGSHYQPPPNSGGGAPVTGNGNSQRNTPSTNSTESNNSPNSVTGGGNGGAGGMDHSRGGNGQQQQQMGYYPNTGTMPHHSGHPLVMHQPLMGSPANPGGHPGMYVKLGQTYFPHPTIATPMGGNRRSPPNEIRPQFNHHPHSLTTGLYPMNMQISGPRHGASGPRHSHHNSYKGSR